MTPDAVEDPPLERQRRPHPPRRQQQDPQRQPHRRRNRMVRPALRFLAIAVMLAVPALILVVLDQGWSIGVGVALLLVASAPTIVACALLVSALVARWAARRQPFA
jgi:membrane protein YdbS with pleckstrin-like domain